MKDLGAQRVRSFVSLRMTIASSYEFYPIHYTLLYSELQYSCITYKIADTNATSETTDITVTNLCGYSLSDNPGVSF